VRRALGAQPFIVVRLGRLAPADAGLVLALLRQQRLVVLVVLVSLVSLVSLCRVIEVA
jgi:hypothetical protein